MTREQLIEDLKVMIDADAGHLREAIAEGNEIIAQRHREAVRESRRQLKELES